MHLRKRLAIHRTYAQWLLNHSKEILQSACYWLQPRCAIRGRGFRVHTLMCRGSGLPLFFLLSPANFHDAPFAQRLLTWAMRLYRIHPRVVRLDAAYWGLHLIAWIHQVLGAVAVVAYNPKNRKKHSCLPPTWTRKELGKRSSIERFFGRVFLFFHLQRPPLVGWSEVASQVALAQGLPVKTSNSRLSAINQNKQKMQ